MLFRKIILMMAVVFLGGLISYCGKDRPLSPVPEEAGQQVAEKDSIRAAKFALTSSVPGFSLTAAGQEAVECSWDAVTQDPTPRDWRIRWKKTSDPAYPSWTDDHGNAYPTGTSHTITGLECGVEYEASIRPRYHGSAGDWTEASGSTSPCETIDKGGSTTPPTNARVPRDSTDPPMDDSTLPIIPSVSFIWSSREIREGEIKHFTLSIVVEPVRDNLYFEFKGLGEGVSYEFKALKHSQNNGKTIHGTIYGSSTGNVSGSYFAIFEIESKSGEYIDKIEEIRFVVQNRYGDEEILGRTSITVIPDPEKELVIEPKLLEILPPDLSGDMEIRLKSAPEGTVWVSMNFPDLVFRVFPYELEFTPSNWSEFQTLTFTLNPRWEVGYYGGGSVDFDIRSNDESWIPGYYAVTPNLYPTAIVVRQIPDPPSYISVSATSTSALADAVGKVSDEWTGYSQLGSILDGDNLMGFDYHLFVYGESKKKFDTYAATKCVSFSTDAITTGKGGLGDPAIATFDADSSQWNLPDSGLTVTGWTSGSSDYSVNIKVKNCN